MQSLWACGWDREKFLLADSEPGQRRIFIFVRGSWLQYFLPPSLYIVSTLNAGPKFFYQVFAILAKKHDGVQPIYKHIVRMFKSINKKMPTDLFRPY